ncbi:hypothetical protein WN55_10814 [Dufourea novaeangliae]|uniref:Uncharacterized protein n=1 Tax=Dufourea novaeangliae TaxID=178035 RepID=A0A154P982_DUFNO|nr:hypothetical protein WN55_10814 [Dufourea novaeangliae]
MVPLVSSGIFELERINNPWVLSPMMRKTVTRCHALSLISITGPIIGFMGSVTSRRAS